MNIVLIGMPGSGKSTVGRSLARRLQRPFFDSDTVIEQRLGCSIRAYFDAEGEVAFRDVEQAVIGALTQETESVLATGGGAVLRAENRRHLHERGIVIYLRTSPEQLFRRLRHDTKRPLLQGPEPFKRLQTLHAERDPLYRECAHYVLDAHGTSLAMLTGRIIMQLELMGHLPGSAPAFKAD